MGEVRNFKFDTDIDHNRS